MNQYRKELLHSLVRTIIIAMHSRMLMLKRDAEAENMLSTTEARAAFCRNAGEAMVRIEWMQNPMTVSALSYASASDAAEKPEEGCGWKRGFEMNAYADICERAAWKMSDWIDSGDLDDWIESTAFACAAEAFRRQILDSQN